MHHVRIWWREIDVASVVVHCFLRVALKISRCLGALPHHLHRTQHILRLIVVGIPQVARPRKITRHLRQHLRKGR